MERNYEDEGSTTRMSRLEIKRNGLYEIQDHTSRSTTNYEYKYPQVGKQVLMQYMKAAYRWSISCKKKNCNL